MDKEKFKSVSSDKYHIVINELRFKDQKMNDDTERLQKKAAFLLGFWVSLIAIIFSPDKFFDNFKEILSGGKVSFISGVILTIFAYSLIALVMKALKTTDYEDAPGIDLISGDGINSKKEEISAKIIDDYRTAFLENNSRLGDMSHAFNVAILAGTPSLLVLLVIISL